MYCLLKLNKSQTQNIFSTFHRPWIHLLTVLGLFTDQNDSFSCPFINPKPGNGTFWVKPFHIGYYREYSPPPPTHTHTHTHTDSLGSSEIRKETNTNEMIMLAQKLYSREVFTCSG